MIASVPAEASATAPTSEREMLIEMCDLVARVLQRMPWIEATLVISIALFMYRFVPPTLFVTWAVLTVGVEAVRARYATGVLRRGDAIDPQRTHRVFVIHAAVAGATVGLGAIIFLPRLPILDQAFFGMILMIMPAAGVAVSQSSRYMALSYSLGIIVPSVTTWVVLHPEQALSASAGSLLYCVLIFIVAAEGNRLLLRSIMIRHERDRLVRDLEQRNIDVRAAMTQAEHSALARARVLAAASHDLRQPLHALSVYSAVLAANPPPEAMREVAGNIDQIVRSLGSLLHALLDLSRLSSGHYTIDRQVLSLDQLMRSVGTEFARAAEDKGLRLITDLQTLNVEGDPMALGRVIRNLIDNAIKYTDNGTITLSVGVDPASDPPVAVISVADTGKGIPASELEKIFEEFYQLDNPGRDRSKGVGLGLAIVQRLCELSGAQICVQSEIGVGTCFSVRIATVIAAHRAATDQSRTVPAAAPPTALAGRSIYVIDDEIDILKSMTRLLGLWGARALSADSAAAAVKLFEAHGKPDLLITDLRLGSQENGAELTLRLWDRFGAFPALVTTGEISAEVLSFTQEHGLELLHKPITEEALRRTMSRLLAPLSESAPSSTIAASH